MILLQGPCEKKSQDPYVTVDIYICFTHADGSTLQEKSSERMATSIFILEP